MGVLRALDALLSESALRRWPNQTEIRELVADADDAVVAAALADLPFVALARALDDDELLALARAARGDALPSGAAAVEPLLAELEADPQRREVHRRIAMTEMRLLRAGDYDALVDLCVGKIAADPSATRRAAALADLAQLLEREIGDPSRAFNALLAGYAEAPDRSNHDDLERLAAATGRWSELAEAMTCAAPRLRPRDQRGAWLRAARLYRDRVGDPEAALTAIERALAIVPADADALAIRAELLRDLGRWDALCETIEAIGELRDTPRTRATAAFERGRVLELELHDEQRAADCYARALEIDPACHDARDALMPLLRRGRRFGELARLLENQLERADADDQLELERELARLHERHLDDPGTALARWQAVRDRLPTDAEALRALARLHADADRLPEQIDALAALAGILDDPKQRADVYFDLARCWLRRDDRRKAEECLEWVLSFAPQRSDALRELAQLYCGDGHWRAAIDVYGRWAAVAPIEERAQVFVDVAQIYERQLDDFGRAIDYYRDALAVAPDCAEAAAGLARLAEQREQVDEAIEALTRLAEITDHPADRADACWRAGRLCDDDAEAEQQFCRALDAHAGHAAAARALAALHEGRGDTAGAARILRDAAAHADDDLIRARLLTEAAARYEEIRADERAADAYRGALDADPDHEEAAARLIDLYERRGDHGLLIQLQAEIARRPAPRGVQVARWLRLARTATSLGDDVYAREAYGRVAELAPDLVEAQRAHGEHRFEDGEWSEAREALTRAFELGGLDMTRGERVELRYRLAVCQLELGETASAREHLDAALALDPSHRPSLMARLRAHANDARVTLETKRALIATASPAEQAGLWAEIGDELRVLGNGEAAIDAYESSLALEADNQRVLHRLLDAHVARRSWSAALTVLDRLAKVERNGTVRARYRHTAAMICRDEIDDAPGAIERLRGALADDPGLARAHAALEALLIEAGDRDELVRYYSTAVRRIANARTAPEAGEQLRLWAALGELIADDPDRRDDAIAALSVAAKLDPDNTDRRVRLAALCEEAGGEYTARAIDAHQWLLARDPNREASYAALERLHRAAGREREADACAEALSTLRGESRRAPTEPIDHGDGALTRDAWTRLRHPDEQADITSLLALVAPVFAAEIATRHQKLATGSSVRSGTALGRALERVGVRVGGSSIRATLSKDQREPVRIHLQATRGGAEPVIVLGKPLADQPGVAATEYELGRAFAYLRPGRLMRAVLPGPAEVARLLDAAIAIGLRAEGANPRLTPAIDAVVRAVERSLTPVALEQVATIGRSLLASRVDCNRAAGTWWRAAELTGGRVGLAVAGDLRTAVRRARAHPLTPGGPLPEERATDLVRAAVSDGVLAARRQVEAWD